MMSDKEVGANLEARPDSPELVLKTLLDGNARWATAMSIHPRTGFSLRHRLAYEGQKPFAAILSCADSRVPSELLFDVGLGDLFVVRVAGNSLGKLELQSLQYAAEQLEVGTILVMGHSSCGAVQAAVETYPEAPTAELLSAIYPAIEEARDALARRGEEPGNRTALGKEVIDRHILSVVNQLRSTFKDIAIIGARYDLHNGRVMVLVK
jgi:carbonic anhydrase